MVRRVFLFAAAIFMIVSAEALFAQHTSRAAEECMTKPGTAAPQGSHWYYHLDRANNRQCWYLAAEGAKVRPQTRPAASPAKSQSPKPIARSEAAPEPSAYAGAPVQTIPIRPSAEMTVGQVGADENDPAEVSSKDWSSLSASAVSHDRTAVPTAQDFPDNQSHARPLMSPAVAPAEPLVVEQRDEPTGVKWNALLVAVAGFAAMIVAVAFAAFALRKRVPSQAQHRSAAHSGARRRGERAFSGIATVVVASAGQTDMPRPKVSSPPLSPVDDIELSVRRLLHQLQQREHAPRDRDWAGAAQLLSPGRNDGYGTTMKRRAGGRSMAG
jgi:hypothetical protein